MKIKAKYRVLYYIAVLLFIVYFILTAIPNIYTDENKIYFSILFVIPFVILLIYDYLIKKKKNEKKIY